MKFAANTFKQILKNGCRLSSLDECMMPVSQEKTILFNYHT